jgi:ATP-dependent protease HslVU (ClpYQ) peptidase subunit
MTLGIDMKKSLFITILCAAAGLGVARAANRTFTGEIMDSQCAQMASHDNMMKGEGATNAKECTIACVKSGGKYALYDPAAKRAYQLDNQKKAAAFAGQKVTITGSLDSDSDSINVKNIQPGS